MVIETFWSKLKGAFHMSPGDLKFFCHYWIMGVCWMAIEKNLITIRHTPPLDGD
jgi:hypothetical protein